MGVAAIGMVFTGISTGLSVYSQMQQGETAERVAEYNNDLANQKAENQELEFAEATKRERITQREHLATLRARIATQGTDPATGTPVLAIGETASRFQLGIADAARRSATEADSLRAQGKMGLWEGQQVKQASTLGAIGTGIAGISQSVSAFGHNRYTGAIR